MLADTYPIQVLLMKLSCLVNRHQAAVIAYLAEETQVLKEPIQKGTQPIELEQVDGPRLQANNLGSEFALGGAGSARV